MDDTHVGLTPHVRIVRSSRYAAFPSERVGCNGADRRIATQGTLTRSQFRNPSCQHFATADAVAFWGKGKEKIESEIYLWKTCGKLYLNCGKPVENSVEIVENSTQFSKLVDNSVENLWKTPAPQVKKNKTKNALFTP